MNEALFSINIFNKTVSMGTSDILDLISILVSGVIAYHIYSLTKRLSFSSKMAWKENVQRKAYLQLAEIRKGIRSEVELINLRRYDKDYPQNNNASRRGYTYLAAGLKDVRFDGIEFFESMPLACYLTEDNRLTIKETNTPAPFNIYSVGLIPFDWFEYIDLYGDEYSGRPQFFLKFRGIKNGPYKKLMFYKKTDVDEKDVHALKYEKIEVIVPSRLRNILQYFKRLKR